MQPGTAMVYIATDRWTRGALHLACALAHTRKLEIALVRMIRVQHLAWLGTNLGCQEYIEQCYEQLREYEQIAREYAVPFSSHIFQYHSNLSDALIDAAVDVNARVVFATLPATSLSFWRKLQLKNIEHRLMKKDCQLYTLEKPSDTPEWTPSVTAPVLKK